MLLNQLIDQQNNRYNDLQTEIEALQEQQRQIQAYLQKLGSLESKMESAAALLSEAISEINEVCPDELTNYQETINSLFTPVIASLPEKTESVEDEVEPTAPTPDQEIIPTQDKTTTTIDIEPVPSDDEVQITEPVPDFKKLKVGELRKKLREVGLSDKGTKSTLIARLEHHYGITGGLGTALNVDKAA